MEKSEKFKPYINDYKVNLFEIAFLDEETVKLFKSDFGVVADYFVQMRKTGDYIPSAEQLDHVNETLGLMSVITDDRRFEEMLNVDSDMENGKEIKTMCDVLDRAIEKGRVEGQVEGRAVGLAEGRAEGRVEGRAEGKIETILELVKDELLSIANAAMKMEMTEEEFRKKYLIV